MKQKTGLLELIGYIDPADLAYQDWVNVGMALKHEGFSAADWDAWSRRDTGFKGFYLFISVLLYFFK